MNKGAKPHKLYEKFKIKRAIELSTLLISHCL